MSLGQSLRQRVHELVELLRRQLRGRGRKLAAYTAFFCGVFALFLYATFPYDRLRDRLVILIEEQASVRRPLRVRIDDLGPWWFSGLSAEGVTIRQLAGTSLVGDAQPLPADIVLEHVRVRVKLLPLLIGTLALGFEVEAAGGEIVGRLWDPRGDEPELSAELSHLSLQKLPLLQAMSGLPMQGSIDGKLDLQLPAGLGKLNGEAELHARALRIGDGKAKLGVPGLQQGFTIEMIDAGALDLRLTAKEGVAQIEQFAIRGPDLAIDGKGSLRLSPLLRYSRLDLTMRIAFADRYRNRNDRTRALFALMEFTPQLRAATTSDGALQYRLQGTLSGLTATPNGQSRM